MCTRDQEQTIGIGAYFFSENKPAKHAQIYTCLQLLYVSSTLKTFVKSVCKVSPLRANDDGATKADPKVIRHRATSRANALKAMGNCANKILVKVAVVGFDVGEGSPKGWFRGLSLARDELR